MNKKLRICTILIFSCPVLLSAYPAEASEINVSSNGNDTTNEAVVNSSNTSEVNQANNLQSANQANSASETGGNEASNNNSGGNTVTTGDAGVVTNINNSANTSSVTTGCCPESVNNTAISISNNGSGSNSTADVNNTGVQTINAENSSNITNQTVQKAVTGQNSNSFNNGSGRIKTGDIYSEVNINNTGINNTKLNIQTNNDSDTHVKIDGNGAFSENKVKLDKRTKQIISNEHNTVIKNYIRTDYITGDNKSIYNTGLFDIITGGIFAKTSINNSLNKNVLDIACCVKKANAQEKEPIPGQKGEDKPSQQPAAAPSSSATATSISSGNSNSSGSSGPGTSSGEVAGITARHLPITGNNWLFFSLLGNIIMLFFGAYLRLRSGNSPPAYALA